MQQKYGNVRRVVVSAVNTDELEAA
ncbi:MAG: hypothetical protein QG655_3736, partial [Actinomycetota bacterium]|nr:hypothetical protein [Actinomycetota bacterium]